MNLNEDDVRALRRQGELTALLKHARAQGATENARRRALVLRHPDLAAKLTEPPLRHTLPEHWTGYIPPEYDPPTVGGHQPLNNSAARAALLALVAEAERRTTGHAPAIAA
ncbi:hypothetical protein [Streptomyces sp. NPDC053367]|uniref:hypothetical protein n=1 Tax=Streptomyces sp. NPDC053367 TaxID=3365700 RepID=UPI0037D608BD